MNPSVVRMTNPNSTGPSPGVRMTAIDTATPATTYINLAMVKRECGPVVIPSASDPESLTPDKGKSSPESRLGFKTLPDRGRCF